MRHDRVADLPARLALAVMLAWLLQGCGHKGSLMLPAPAAQPAEAHPPASGQNLPPMNPITGSQNTNPATPLP